MSLITDLLISLGELTRKMLKTEPFTERRTLLLWECVTLLNVERECDKFPFDVNETMQVDFLDTIGIGLHAKGFEL